MAILIYILLATGLAIGFISGLLGIGGGIIMTPVQLWLYAAQGWSSDGASPLKAARTRSTSSWSATSTR